MSRIPGFLPRHQGRPEAWGRAVGEIVDCEPHDPEVLHGMRDHLEDLKRLGVEAIDD